MTPDDPFDEPTRRFDFGDDALPPRRGPRGRPPRGPAPTGGRKPGERPRRASTFSLDDLGQPDLPKRPREPRARRPRRPAWQRLAMAAAAIALLIVVVTGGVRAVYSGEALPGTKVGGEDVGGQDEAAIRNTVRRLADPNRRLSVIGPDGSLQVTADGGGLQADIDATVARALNARRGSFFAPLASVTGGRDIPLQADIDDDRLRSSVARIAGEIDRTPYAGALDIDPQTLAVTTEPSKAGREVDRGVLGDRLRAALLRPGSGAIDVPVETTEAASEAQVRKVADAAESYLTAPLVLRGAGARYEIEPAALAKLLELEPLEGGRRARLGTNADALAALTTKVADARDRSAKSASISAPARGPVLDGKGTVTWKPQSADVSVGEEGRSGLAVVTSTLGKRITKAVHDDAHRLDVPVRITQAPVSRAAAGRVDRVIGTFTTAYIAGQPRVTNIQRIARSVDRTIIAPGQQFSLNGIVGERTKAKGYVEAPFIAGNRIEPSVGGGVSQFSTTMYNAAYFAGLRIDAHQPHSLYIDRYPAGRESTLNWPDIDMKWTNDTSAPILIRTYTDGAGVTVTLYGDNGGRRVTATPGARQPNPGGDFAITVTRRIRYANGQVVEQPTTTRYANEEASPKSQE